MVKIQKPAPKLKMKKPTQIALLEKYLKKNLLSNYISGLDHCFLGFDFGFYGFIEEYYHIAQLLKGKTEYTIFDVGCASGRQHVFFKDFAGYVGIETPAYADKGLKVFYPNAELVFLSFRDFVEKNAIHIPNNSIGIAHMSLLYSPGNLKDQDYFNKLFVRKIIL